MKLALIGLPNAGREMLFGIFSGSSVNEGENRTISEKIKVIDNRLAQLIERYKPKKETYANCELMLTPSLDRKEQSIKVFENLTEADVICCVIREGKECARDLKYIIDELILNDLIIIEEQLTRTGEVNPVRKKLSNGVNLLSRMKTHLEEGGSLRTFEFCPDEQKSLRDYPLLSVKPAVVVLGLESKDTSGSCEGLKADFSRQSLKWFQSQTFRQLPGFACEAAGLISFFTVNNKEGRAWLIPAGTPAPLAARSVHKDMEKGFIRVEVIKYVDFENGRRCAITKGADYIVEDGDILKFLFSAR